MTNFQDASEAIPAKHLFFVMDACYGGLALTRGGGAAATGDRSKYFFEVTRRGARQVLTAGGADEPVADNGPGGHSIFTWTLLQGLRGKADLDNDGVVTATELGAYVGPAVSALSHQTPAFGHLVGSEGGEFVFTLQKEPEFLNADADALEAEATRLDAELERVRKALAAKRAGPQVAAAPGPDGGAPVAVALAVRGVTADAGGPDAGSTPAEQLRRALDEGLALHKQKRFAEAAAAFEVAARLAPTNVLAANNLGFTYFKLERYADAATWYERSIALDPRRAIAHANLGDAYVKLARLPEARRAYERYLELAPRSKLASGVKERLASSTLLPPDAGAR
jgi:Flp pilus assembly protein TadD